MADNSEPKFRHIAWDGVCFEVPANWELGLYKYPSRRSIHVEIEDEYAVRLEGEWTRPKRQLDMDDVQKRYEKTVHRITRKAERNEIVKGLPDGWIATAYLFREGQLTQDAKDIFQPKQWLLTAFYLQPGGKFFAYFLLHIYPEDKESPQEVIRHVAKTMEVQDEGLRRWSLFDIDFEVPSDFQLESTQFDIGAKRMVFRWKLRRFHIWHFSLASHFLEAGETPEEWFSGHLNGLRDIRGHRFYPAADGEVTHKRKRIHAFGHSDEIARWCFKWKCRCRVDPERDMLVAWLFNYRRAEDLKVIPESLRFGRDIFQPNTPADPDWLEKKKARRNK